MSTGTSLYQLSPVLLLTYAFLRDATQFMELKVWQYVETYIDNTRRTDGVQVKNDNV